VPETSGTLLTSGNLQDVTKEAGTITSIRVAGWDSTPYTLHPALYTLHPIPHTLRYVTAVYSTVE